MPNVNVIDALVTTLTLDNTGFRKGTKESLADQQKIREAGTATANQVETANKRMAQSFTTVRNEVVGLFLAIAGARTIKDFTAGIIAGDAATGRLAGNLGIATDKLSAWEGAIGRVGGNAKSADAALQSMVSAVQDYKLTGNSPIGPDLMGLGVTKFDDPSQMLLQIAKAGERMNKPEFAARLGRLGFDQDTINLLGKGSEGVQQLLNEQEKLGVVTDKDAAAAQEFESQMSKLSSTIKGSARPEITGLVTGLTAVVQGLSDANATGPLVIGTLSAVAIAATAAAGPWVLLAGAIGAVVIAYRDLQNLRHMSADERKKFDDRGSELRSKAAAQLARGDIGGALGTFWEGFSERSGIGSHQGGASPTAGAGGDIAAYMRAQGFSAEQARGIAAGAAAEGGGLGFAANGAFGIGQWRGARQRALFRRYGNHPSREQQLAFLASELKGGDPGGAAVRGSTSAYGAMSAYVTAFMRPGPGTAGDLQRGAQFLGGKPMPVAAGGSGSSSVSIGHMTVVSNDPKSFARKDLASALKDRGLIIQAQRGVTP